MNESSRIAEQMQHLSAARWRLATALVFVILLALVSAEYTWNGRIDLLQLPPYADPTILPLGFALLQLLLTLPILLAGLPVFIQAARDLLRLRASADALIVLGVLAALAWSLLSMLRLLLDQPQFLQQLYFLWIGCTLLLALLGKYLEACASSLPKRMTQAQLAVLPSSARVENLEGEHLISLEDIRPNDILVIHPGEILPADGIITEGVASLDESLLTGCPQSAIRGISDEVFCSSVSKAAVFKYRVTHVGQATRLFRGLQRLEAVSAKLQSSVKRVRISAAACILAACLLAGSAAVSWFMSDAPFGIVLMVFLTVLITAAPCSLSLSSAPALWLTMKKGLSAGILLRGGEVLETARHVDVLVLDKTGTITAGHPAITDIIPEGVSQDTLLALAASAEKDSRHPAALALTDAAKRRRLRIQRLAAFSEVSGCGVEALLNGQTLRVGRGPWIAEQDVRISAELLTKADQLASKGKTPIFISTGNICKGIIALQDAVRPESQEAIASLKAAGIRVMMLTSDGRRTANAIAKEAGITDVRADILPADKEREIQLLQARGSTVAMLGHDRQDNAALARADIHILTGAAADIETERIDILLLHGDLRDVSRALLLSRQSMRCIRWSIRSSLLCSLPAVFVAMGGLRLLDGPFLLPWMALAAFLLSAGALLFHALRLRSFQFPAYRQKERFIR